MRNRNNFDFLRFLFSFLVVIGHAILLSRKEEFQNDFLASLPLYGVFSFFIISGFLVFGSYERLQNLRKYTENRLRRILPAYVFVVSFFAFFLYFFSDAAPYFNAQWLKYLISNLTFLNFLEPCLPGVFMNNWLCAVNGSLWTIKIELMFYMFIPLLYLGIKSLTRVQKNWVLGSVYALSLAYFLIMQHLGKEFLAKQLPGNLFYFASGILVYINLDFFKKWKNYLVLPALLIVVLEKLFLGFTFLFPLAWAVVLFWFAFSKIPLQNFARYGDFSYGIYLVHFPIIQLFIQEGWYNEHAFVGLFLTFLIIVFFSIFLWNFIEKPFLRKKNYSKT